MFRKFSLCLKERKFARSPQQCMSHSLMLRSLGQADAARIRGTGYNWRCLWGSKLIRSPGLPMSEEDSAPTMARVGLLRSSPP